MATESSSAGDKLIIYADGEKHELIVRIRYTETPQISAETLSNVAAATVGAWLRAWRAIHDNSWSVGEVDMPEKKYLTQGQLEARKEHRKKGAEPYVTVFNKTFDGLSITVHSHDNGQEAVTAAAAFVTMKEVLAEKRPKLFNPESAAPVTPPASKKDINNVDDFIPPYQGNPSDKQEASQGNAEGGKVANFRFFKRIAPTVIQLQEFVQGQPGKDKYQKSATEATISFHKTNPQYDEGALVYFPITGEIQIKEGNYGKQAIIPTAKGRIYVDAQFNGQEKVEWGILSQDLGDEYSRLANDESAKLFAPNSVVVLKMSEIKDGKQWKNLYRLYTEIK